VCVSFLFLAGAQVWGANATSLSGGLTTSGGTCTTGEHCALYCSLLYCRSLLSWPINNKTEF
jgi:hypothetical protein